MRMMNRMYRCRRAISHDLGALSDDMRSLMTATAELAGNQIDQARRRLNSTMIAGKELSSRYYGKAAHAARTTGQVVKDHPYQSIGVALALSALMGVWWRRRSER
jgi:ElaB/YqjD/DUF883 family membrane-anchored ribosome-binding protein